MYVERPLEVEPVAPLPDPARRVLGARVRPPVHRPGGAVAGLPPVPARAVTGPVGRPPAGRGLRAPPADGGTGPRRGGSPGSRRGGLGLDRHLRLASAKVGCPPFLEFSHGDGGRTLDSVEVRVPVFPSSPTAWAPGSLRVNETFFDLSSRPSTALCPTPFPVARLLMAVPGESSDAQTGPRRKRSSIGSSSRFPLCELPNSTTLLSPGPQLNSFGSQRRSGSVCFLRPAHPRLLNAGLDLGIGRLQKSHRPSFFCRFLPVRNDPRSFRCARGARR